MKIQRPTEFLTFTSGTCNVYSVAGNKIDQKLMTLAFGDRTVGFKRHYAARAAGTQIERLIQVPLQREISAVNRVVIDGAEYKIEQAQHLADTNPPTTILTLRKG
jgi:hypothetical protein